MERLESAFRNCEKLQKHMSLLLDKGGLYKTFNGNLLFHGCIPLNEDGSLKEVQIYGKTYKGKELYDVLEAYVRRAFFAVDNEEQRKGRDILWFIWASPNSPLFRSGSWIRLCSRFLLSRWFLPSVQPHPLHPARQNRKSHLI